MVFHSKLPRLYSASTPVGITANKRYICNSKFSLMSKVKIHTQYGDMLLRLYDETPAHRDNFLKLVREGFYNGTLFHRVIKDFMIQGGDPQSVGAPRSKALGSGDVGYTIEAEFNPALFHKRGALCAARQGDQVNPEKRSSGCQFYIVWGKTYNDSQIAQLERQMKMQALQGEFDALVRERRDEILQLRRNRDQAGLLALQDELEAMANAQVAQKQLGKLSDEQKKCYRELGGTPFLDGQYTVFGEIESGLDIVAKIQAVGTDSNDRPLKDIEMSAEVID